MTHDETGVVPYATQALPTVSRVIVFAPHPDDEVYGCGGALALHVQAGATVRVVLLTNGGHQGDAATPDYERQRLRESQSAAGELGIPAPESWGLDDRSLEYGEVLVGRLHTVLLAYAPELVYVPSVWEPHPDHRATALSVLEAVRRLKNRPAIHLFEVGGPGRPNCLIDVTGVWGHKTRAMAAFHSQEQRLPYAEFISALNRYRALTVAASAQYVEAYTRIEPESIEGLRMLLLGADRTQLPSASMARHPDDLPLVSVLVRSAGRATLRRALESVRLQTYRPIEVVVIDVAPLGEAEMMARADVSWQTGWRIASLGRPLSRSAAANAGLDCAKGDACLFLDDDDWLYPDHIAKLVDELRKGSEHRAVHTDVECVNDEGQRIGQVFDFAYRPQELIYGNFLPIHSVLFRADLVRDGCRFDEVFDLYEDWDFWLQVERHTAFRHVAGVSAAYRVNATSGAGVHVDRQRALSATADIFRKWRVSLSEQHFAEFVTRTLQLRQTARETQSARLQLESARSESVSLGARLKEVALLASQQQNMAMLAQQEADKARSDAAHYLAAHEAACSARDLATGARDQAERDLHAALLSASEWQSAAERANSQVSLHQARVAQIQGAHDQAVNERDALLHARRQLEAELHQAHLQTQERVRQIDELLASRSWRITRPIRAVGSGLRKLRRLGLAWSVLRSRGRSPVSLVKRTLQVVRDEGVSGVRLRASRVVSSASRNTDSSVRDSDDSLAAASHTETMSRGYDAWVAAFDTVNDKRVASWRRDLTALSTRPRISIVMPVFRPNMAEIGKAIDSVKAQIYPDWELCICDDASDRQDLAEFLAQQSKADSRVRVLARAVNGHIAAATADALGLATGQWVCFLDQDDELRPHALLRVAQALGGHPQARMIYSDEDKIDDAGRRFDPYFKTDFNLGLLRSHNYACHFLAMERELIRSIGGMRTGFDGAQDYDLVLRAVDAISADAIHHIPEVLYHWRAGMASTASGHSNKSYAFAAGQRALNDHLVRRGLAGEAVSADEAPGMYRIRWSLPQPVPLVSIIIPTRNGVDLLRQCLDSLQITTYPNFEVCVIDNGSDDPAALALMDERQSRSEIKVIRDERPFNFSALNNRAVRECARGEFVLLLNNDIEITHPDWLDEMVGPALEEGVGCVGARLWYPNQTLQHAGVVMVCGVAGHAHKHLPRGHHGYMGRAVLAQDFVAVTAACLLVRRRIYDEVEGLDESLAVAFNDVDFCLRVHSRGYRNHWTPYASLIHHESLTRGYEDTPEKQIRFKREIDVLQSRWQHLIDHDPCYNPNLTSQSEDFSLAWPPRVASLQA